MTAQNNFDLNAIASKINALQACPAINAVQVPTSASNLFGFFTLNLHFYPVSSFFFNPIPTSLFPTIPFPLIFFHFPNLTHPVSCVYCFPISSISQSRTSMFYFLFSHPHFQRAHQKCAPCCIKAQQRSLRRVPPINIQKYPQRIILCVVFLDYLFLQRFILCAVSCRLFIFCNGLF